ncbi:MAG: hypothetical protein AAFR81_30305 [Chloroflexota bacterium]
MSNLQQVLEDIRSEIQIMSNGRGVGSIRAVARLCDVDESGLRRHFKGADLTPSKLAESLISHGFKPADLEAFSQSGVPDIAIALDMES